jgi:hypothetical protein
MWHVGGTDEFIHGVGGGGEGKRPIGRLRRRGEENMKSYIQ